MFRHFLCVGGVLAASLGFGTIGYRCTEQMEWIDAVLNAAMILTGMGPVTTLRTPEGKIFATVYALFSGIVFLSMMAVILAPVVHRVFHTLHLQVEDGASPQGPD